MIGRLTQWLRPQRQPAVVPDLPSGERVYCVGDIHGRLDLLEKIHDKIQHDSEKAIGRNTLVYLGDYVDRGMRSKEVIDALIDAPLSGFDIVHLRGNHEQAMLDFLEHAEAGFGWLQFGGKSTLASYGVQVRKTPRRLEELESLRASLEAQVPDQHLDFLNGLKASHTVGAYYFVHAGIRPGRPLEEQTLSDQLWIREEFTRHRAHHEKIIVHGHTIADEPEVRENRIGIDTGAYYSEVLTCLVLEGSSRRFLNTDPSDPVAL